MDENIIKIWLTLRLLNMEGSVMACASSQQAGADITTSAIAANIWRVYEKVGKVAFQQQNLSFISLDCEVSTTVFISNIIIIDLYILYFNLWVQNE